MTKKDTLQSIARKVTGDNTLKCNTVRSALHCIAEKAKGEETNCKTINEALTCIDENIENLIGGDRTAEAITITENGVVNTPVGKFYNPITVNVPTGGEAPKIKLYAWKYNDGSEDKVVYTTVDMPELEEGNSEELHAYFYEENQLIRNNSSIYVLNSEGVTTVNFNGYDCERDSSSDVEQYSLPELGVYDQAPFNFYEGSVVPAGAKILYPNDNGEYVVGDGVKTLSELYQAKGLSVYGSASFVCSHYDISIYYGYSG